MKTLKKGWVVHVCGWPVELLTDVDVTCSLGTWNQILADVAQRKAKLATHGVGVIYGPAEMTPNDKLTALKETVAKLEALVRPAHDAGFWRSAWTTARKKVGL